MAEAYRHHKTLVDLDRRNNPRYLRAPQAVLKSLPKQKIFGYCPNADFVSIRNCKRLEGPRMRGAHAA